MTEVMEMEARIKNYVSKELEKIGNDVNKLTNKISKDSAKQTSELQKTGKSVKSLGGNYDVLTKSVGKFITVAGGLYVLKKVGDYAKTAIGQASDLNETFTKAEVLFKSTTKAIIAWSENTEKAFGQTQKQAIDAAASFAVFGKSAGLIGKDLNNFSTNLTELASDLASFFNTTVDDAIVALSAGLRGEALPLRRYGVLLNEATLKQKAFEMGIVSSTKGALMPQQRVLAAYQVILDQTSDAQGDFARTADGLANTSRTVKAQFEEISTEIGKSLLPITSELAIIVRDQVAPALKALATGPLKDTLENVNNLIEPINTIVNLFKKLNTEVAGDIFKRVSDSAIKALPGIGKLASLLSTINMFSKKDEKIGSTSYEQMGISRKAYEETEKTAGIESTMPISPGLTAEQKKQAKLIADEIKAIDKDLLDSKIAHDEYYKELSMQYDEEQLQKEIEKTKEILEAYNMLEEAKINNIQNEYQKELALLKFKHDQELAMVEGNEQAKSLIMKKYQIERQTLENALKNESAKKDKQLTNDKINYTESITDSTMQMISNISAASKTSSAAQKTIDIAQATANTALGVTKAISKGQFFMAPFIATLGATQIAKIASQKYQGGGIIPGNSTSGDKVPVMANPREMILNQQQQANLFDMIRHPPTNNNTISNNENITLNLHVGNGSNYDMNAARYTVEKLVPVIGDVLLKAKNQGRLRHYESAR